VVVVAVIVIRVTLAIFMAGAWTSHIIITIRLGAAAQRIAEERGLKL
jgi:hypothetical protein